MLDSLIKIILIIFFLSQNQIVIASVENPNLDYTLMKSEGGIKVYSKILTNSKFPQFKVTATLQRNIFQVIEFLNKDEGCPQWQSTCISSIVLERPSQFERYIYKVIDTPWPLADRDMVLYSKSLVDQSRKTIVVNVISAPDKYPKKEYERIEFNSSVQITAISENETQLTMISHADLKIDFFVSSMHEKMAEKIFLEINTL